MHTADEKFVYAVFDRSGHLLTGDTDIPFLAGQTAEPLYRDGLVDGEPARIARIMELRSSQLGGRLYIEVAQTNEVRQQFAVHLLESMILPDVFMILIGAGAAFLGIKSGLLPLNQVAKTISLRSRSDLRTVPEENVPREVKPLIEAINGLLIRLREEIESQQRFLANAAHQFRTPVAGLKAYVGYAKRLKGEPELHDVIEQIDHGIDRLTNLANGMLNLAKFDPVSGTAMHERSVVDLNQIALTATTELSPNAVAKDIELSLEVCGEPAKILGNPLALNELLSNLVQNAILYTQSGGHVAVRIESLSEVSTQRGITSELRYSLIVEDDGPGIPEAEREHVFERFYRILGTETSGSGLGLAIVDEIAKAHNARIQLASGLSGKGTSVRVSFSSVSADGVEARESVSGLSESSSTSTEVKLAQP